MVGFLECPVLLQDQVCSFLNSPRLLKKTSDCHSILVGAAVYTTVLTNVTTEWTRKLVPEAAVAAGLARSDVSELMTLINTPGLATTYSEAIVAAVGGAIQQAYVHGIR